MVENREEEDGEGEEERCWSDAIAAVVDAVDEKIRLTDEHERFETGERAEETQEQGADVQLAAAREEEVSA